MLELSTADSRQVWHIRCWLIKGMGRDDTEVDYDGLQRGVHPNYIVVKRLMRRMRRVSSGLSKLSSSR